MVAVEEKNASKNRTERNTSGHGRSQKGGIACVLGVLDAHVRACVVCRDFLPGPVTSLAPLSRPTRGAASSSNAAVLRIHHFRHSDTTLLTTMAICTLADLQARSQRSSSIPRHYHRIAEAERRDERFSVADAAQLKLKLQALDKVMSGMMLPEHSHELDMNKITEATRSQSSRGTVYVAGSEEFYLVVKPVSRPDLIPDVYAEACKTMLRGTPYVNRYDVSDFTKGVDPIFSEIRCLLPEIDRVCETDLGGAVARLEARGKLRFPTGALQVFANMCNSQGIPLSPPSC